MGKKQDDCRIINVDMKGNVIKDLSKVKVPDHIRRSIFNIINSK